MRYLYARRLPNVMRRGLSVIFRIRPADQNEKCADTNCQCRLHKCLPTIATNIEPMRNRIDADEPPTADTDLLIWYVGVIVLFQFQPTERQS